MARRPTGFSTSPRTTPRKRGGVEWIGGTATLPTYVKGEGEPYRPKALLWLSSDGAIVGTTMARPSELLSMASDSLRDATLRPMFGQPHTPTRVRVASAELADVLRTGHPGLEVVCAPTPEADAVLAKMCAAMDFDDDSEPESYLSDDVSPDTMAALFSAAAALYRTTPWKVVTDDTTLFSITIDALDLRDAVVSIFGQGGEAFGFIVFAGMEDFMAFITASDNVEHGERPDVPPHLSLSFERGGELAPELKHEIKAHGWEVAGPRAYPVFAVVDDGLVLRPLSDRAVTILEAVAGALTRVMPEKKALQKAWRGGDTFIRTLSVTTHRGELAVDLFTPCKHAPFGLGSELDIMGGLLAVDLVKDKDSDNVREALEAALMEHFFASPEGREYGDPNAIGVLLEFGYNFLDHTVANLRAKDLRTLLFEIVPARLSMPASEAGAFIAELRAFYTFLKREYALKHADACLAVLGGDADKQLEAAMSDSSKFGLTKSLLMSGAEAGFDINSIDGIQTMFRALEGKPLPPSFQLPGFPPPDAGASATTQRNRRKGAARKAKKK